ncbi:hypothetical protein H3C66_00780 [Patescibacteria group bacterium]|nr:hypothetical protein [Patescibacteria group bacterium]
MNRAKKVVTFVFNLGLLSTTNHPTGAPTPTNTPKTKSTRIVGNSLFSPLLVVGDAEGSGLVEGLGLTSGEGV